MSDQPTNQNQDLRTALENASKKLAAALDNLQSLEVETRWIQVANNALNESDSRLVAKTRIALDGDTTVIIPVQDENGALAPDQALLDMHHQAVDTAMEYRAKLIAMITDFVRQARAR